MVFSDMENLIYDIKMSTVVPATMTGENVVHEFTNMDLAMKLHYIKGVYFFKANWVKEITIENLKAPMFKWLELCHKSSGRIRRSESGRPFIKCNDSGVRVIEAKCKKTLGEWLEMKDCSLNQRLVSNQVLDPDLAFSPLVMIQLTWFKCGGITVGLNWAHVLGDALSASRFINMWGQIMAEHSPPKSLNIPNPKPKTKNSENQTPIPEESLSVKRVDPVGDKWVFSGDCKMESFTFHLTASQLNQLQSKISNQTPIFESISAVIWKCFAKIREESEPRTVTFFSNKSHHKEIEIFGNNQIISVVKADFCVSEASATDLAALMAEQKVDERTQIEEIVEREFGLFDFIVYGANLTFVDLEEVEIYGLELKGQKPIFANYMIDGVGEEGVVLVLPVPENIEEEDKKARTVTVILPENEILHLKNELRRVRLID